jgi:O-antigen/teichoic acid export membrane protein
MKLQASVHNPDTSSPLQRILRNSTLTLGVQILQVVSNLVVFLGLARILGKEMLGQYYLLFALVLLLQLLLEGGVSTVLTRRMAQAPQHWKETASEAAGIFVLIIAASLSLFLALGTAWAWWHADSSVLYHFAAAGIACAALHVQRFCEGVFQGLEQFGCASLAGIFQATLYVVLILGLAACGNVHLGSIMLMFATSQVAGACWLVLGLRRRWPDWTCRPGLRRLKSWLAESFPLGVGDMVRGPNWQLDTLLLGLFQPSAAVGLYVVAFRPHAPLLCFPRAVLTAAFPAFARLATGNPDALGRAFANSTRLLWIFGLPAVIAVCLAAEPLIAVLVGREYLEAALLMRILIWKTALSFLSIQFRFVFAAVNRQGVYARLVLAILALEAVMEVVLIYFLGPLGACIGCVLGEIAFTTTGLVICHYLEIRGLPWRALGGAFLAAAGMALVFWIPSGLDGVFLLSAISLSTGLYFIFCFLLGAIRLQELRDLADALANLLPRRQRAEV